MDTITVQNQGQTFDIPIAVAFGPAGGPVDLVGDLAPEACNHAGQTWSSCLDLRCGRCGSRLFLPGRLLAYLPEAQVERMHSAWCAAGWPAWRSGDTPGWRISDKWRVVDDLRDFDHLGGLPVRCDRWATFTEAVRP